MRHVHVTIDGQAQAGILQGGHVESIGTKSLETLLAQGVDLSLKPAGTEVK